LRLDHPQSPQNIRASAVSRSKQGGFKNLKLSATAFRHLVNLYPPYLGAGIRVTHVAADFRSVTVRMRLRFYNRNYFGTQFGGSLFSMTNPFYVLMLANILGHEYVIWDKAATIRYLTPGRGTVYAHFMLNDEQVAELRERTASGEKYEPVYSVNIVDDAGTIVATVEQTLYLRKSAAPPMNRSQAAG
jgi:acyl-coenzyme A thioesterase PaaI-like protein